MTGHFSEPGEIPIAPTVQVCTAIGLALIGDESLRVLTGGVIKSPAAALIYDAVAARGPVSAQVLLDAQALAALHGSLIGWRHLQEVDVRDQFDACSAESSRLYAENIAKSREERDA